MARCGQPFENLEGRYPKFHFGQLPIVKNPYLYKVASDDSCWFRTHHRFASGFMIAISGYMI